MEGWEGSMGYSDRDYDGLAKTLLYGLGYLGYARDNTK
jgi:hypothetical protein